MAIETVLAYIKKDDQYLLLYRNKKENDLNKNKWIGVGGHLEKGETPEDALIREIKEETNYDVLSFSKRAIIYFENEDFKEAMHLYLVDKVKGELKECDEGTLKYFKESELFNLPMWEGDKIFLKYLLSNRPYFELKLIYRGDSLIKCEELI